MMLNVRLGPCAVTFNNNALGETKGGVKLTFNSTMEPVTTDQSTSPVGMVETGKTCEIVVPLAEFALSVLAGVIPGSILTVDGVDTTKMRLDISGAAIGSTLDFAAPLVLMPINGDSNDIVTVYHAIPQPNIEQTFDSSATPRVFSVKFTAMAGDNGFVTIGDPSVVVP